MIGAGSPFSFSLLQASNIFEIQQWLISKLGFPCSCIVVVSSKEKADLCNGPHFSEILLCRAQLRKNYKRGKEVSKISWLNQINDLNLKKTDLTKQG